MDVNINTKFGNFNLNLLWLRDNCQCPECYDTVTQQKKRDYVIVQNVKIEKFSQYNDKLSVTWSDGHNSEYSYEWIAEQFHMEPSYPVTLWQANDIQKNIPTIDYSTIKSGGLTQLLKSILKYGLGIVSGVEPTLEATEELVSYIGPLRHTLYGAGMWSLTTDSYEKYQDTAYSNEEISSHTDNTYFYESSGIQVFHYIKNADYGGYPTLVDGFKAATILKTQNRQAYNCLASTLVEWQYISRDYYTKVTEPILKLNPVTKKLQQIRYNMYDRSSKVPITMTEYNLDAFYKSLCSLQEIIKSPKMQWKRPVSPGTVLFINNWRVLHGRTKFTGSRHVCGCYLEMGIMLSKARLLKIIP